MRSLLSVLLLLAPAALVRAEPKAFVPLPPVVCERDCVGVTTIAVGHTKALAGTTVGVPVWVSDAWETPLGREKAQDQQIEALAFRVRFLPASSIVAATVRRGAAFERIPVRFEIAPRTPDGVSYLAVFETRDGPLGFDPSAGRQAVVLLELTLARDLPPGSTIELRLDPATVTLSNAAGTVAENVANGTLRIQDGSVSVR